VVVLALLVGLCFGVQALALGRPDSADLALVHSLALLRTHPAAREALVPTDAAEVRICGPSKLTTFECSRAMVSWFESELGHGAEVARQPVVVSGQRGYAFRIPSVRPRLALLVRSSGLPFGFAVLPSVPLT
jgi:hypothetical protein